MPVTTARAAWTWMAGLLSVCVMSVLAVHAQSAQPRVRHIRWQSDRSIPSQLLPDDEIVIVDTGILDAAAPRGPLTVEQVIEDAAVRADLVAVALQGLTVDQVATVVRRAKKLP